MTAAKAVISVKLATNHESTTEYSDAAINDSVGTRVNRISFFTVK